MDLGQLLETIVVPRPNGSDALSGVAQSLLDHLQGAGVTATSETFTARPLVYLWLGLALFVLGLLVYQCLHARYHRVALILASVAFVLYFCEAVLGLPLVSAIGAKPETNIVVDWSPDPGAAAGGPSTLVILTAHYDSRTDLFSPATTRSLAGKAPEALLLLVALATLAVLAERTRAFAFLDSGGGRFVLLLLAWVALGGLGLAAAAMDGGRITSHPSPGAVDNAGSVAVLAQVAQDLPYLELQHVGVRLVFLAGEEVGCQGSSAYATSHRELREGDGQVLVINLEGLGTGGTLAYREWGGLGWGRAPASEEIVDLIDRALIAGTAEPPLARAEGGRDDAGTFLALGMKAVTLTETRQAGKEVQHTALDTSDQFVPGDIDRVAKALEFTLAIADLEAGLGD